MLINGKMHCADSTGAPGSNRLGVTSTSIEAYAYSEPRPLSEAHWLKLRYRGTPHTYFMPSVFTYHVTSCFAVLYSPSH